MTDAEIIEILKIDNFTQAEKRVKNVISLNPDDDMAYYCLGRLLWKFGKRSEALTAYGKALEINPETPARYALEMGREIFDYFNPDLLNP